MVITRLGGDAWAYLGTGPVNFYINICKNAASRIRIPRYHCIIYKSIVMGEHK